MVVKVMSNDLSRCLFPAKEVKLLIVDEAHKAQGDYAYCQGRELLRGVFIQFLAPFFPSSFISTFPLSFFSSSLCFLNSQYGLLV